MATSAGQSGGVAGFGFAILRSGAIELCQFGIFARSMKDRRAIIRSLSRRIASAR
jgi:hypothetical protein